MPLVVVFPLLKISSCYRTPSALNIKFLGDMIFCNSPLLLGLSDISIKFLMVSLLKFAFYFGLKLSLNTFLSCLKLSELL